MTDLVSHEDALVLAQHAFVVQGGYSTPEIEAERLTKAAESYEDPAAFVQATVDTFRAEVAAQLAANIEQSQDAARQRQHEELTERLGDYRRAAEAEKQAKKLKDGIGQELVPMLSAVGSVLIIDPITHEKMVANVRAPETLVVDAGELLAALIEHLGDEEEAAVIWADTLKPHEVDTKDGGKFHQATIAHGDEPARIPPEVVAKVASYKASKAYPGFGKVGG